MPKFISQELFNMCVVSTVKIATMSEWTIPMAAQKLAEDYGRTYADKDLAGDIILAATEIEEFIAKAFDPSMVGSACHQLQFCIKCYDVSGTPRKKRWLGGTWFHYESAPIADKVRQSIANIATYHFLVVGESIPLAPDGWKL